MSTLREVAQDVWGSRIVGVKGLVMGSRKVVLMMEGGAEVVVWHEKECCEVVEVVSWAGWTKSGGNVVPLHQAARGVWKIEIEERPVEGNGVDTLHTYVMMLLGPMGEDGIASIEFLGSTTEGHDLGVDVKVVGKKEETCDDGEWI